jgi:6-phosphogluconate dehydrogenase
MDSCDIGVIGLAVMGQNLVLNMADKGFKVAVYNRTLSKVEDFVKNNKDNKNIVSSYSLEDFFSKLKKPSIVMFMVQAGEPVDDLIEKTLPFLSKGDVVIDGGNSYFEDTQRRVLYLDGKEIFFVGMGISGGEEGARFGPSIMPGGNEKAWVIIKDIFEKISAKVDDTSCCKWIGTGGSGHFVKMVHNAIEYADMQLIAESYDLLKNLANVSLNKMSNIYADWNTQELNSYLIEITSKILAKKDDDNSFLIEKILDVAKQKGTGKWTSEVSLKYNIFANILTEAVFMRFASEMVDDRKTFSSVYPKERDEKVKIDKVRQALYAAKIITYAQGFMVMAKGAFENGWKLDFANIAQIWRGGCIIRSVFLNKIKEAYEKDPNLISILLDDFFINEVKENIYSLRKVVGKGIKGQIPLSCFSASISFFDSITQTDLPMNLIAAQRDFFGAHTYMRNDKPISETYHTQW